ncbi:sterol desaturase family protein [Marivirga sp.]|uniref:sterol desaturase family protein n=1 Tax=Marivirga sp. TaxID=2018662 RepID=UPI0025FBF415|nr:sterol desaturase family protein [Marivirga sp.]
MSLVYANGLLLLTVLIELAIFHFKRKEKILWQEVIFNLNSGHILLWILRGMEISSFYFVSVHWSFSLLKDWPYPLIWIFTFFTWDFCFYWLHRFHHKFRFLWAVHVVHHEGEHFNLSLGIRNSWYSSLTSFPFFIGLALIGVPVEVFIATSSIHYIVQFYNHNGLVKNSGWLEKIMITPSHHRVHHGINPEYIDRNFGGTLLVWDKLFGTFQQELNTIPIIYGVKDYVKSYNVLWANNLPFLKMFGFYSAKESKKESSYTVPESLIVSGGILLFGLLLYYISIENIWPVNYKLGLFSMTFLGTIANGGISENKKWGINLWLLNFILLAPLLIFYKNIDEPILLTIFSLLAIHSIITLLKCKKYTNDMETLVNGFRSTTVI